MLFKSALVTQASGSIGGMTASRNKGGQYFRARALPTNPNTPEQQAVRQALSDLSVLWGTVLTPAERTAWDVYALNVPIVNKVGDSINLTGQQMYIRSNTPRLQAAEPRVDAGPAIFNIGDFTAPSFAANALAQSVAVTFDNTDGWANEDDAAMLVYISRPQSQTINFFKGPYRFSGVIQGDSTTAPTSPVSILTPFVHTTGQKLFVRVSVSRADGRLASSFRGEAVVS